MASHIPDMATPCMVVMAAAPAPMGIRLMEAMETPIAVTEIQPMVAMERQAAPMGTQPTVRMVVAVLAMEIKFPATERQKR
jgi:hypothetical protein